jgi:hypothetical protein
MGLSLPALNTHHNYELAKKIQGVLIIALIAVIALKVVDVQFSDETMKYILNGFAALSLFAMLGGFFASGTDPFLGLSPIGYESTKGF